MMAMTTSDTQQVYGERYHLVRGDENRLVCLNSDNMNEVKMDSQETTSNAAESPSNRELNVVSYNFTNHRLKVCRNFNPSQSIDISDKFNKFFCFSEIINKIVKLTHIPFHHSFYNFSNIFY